MSIRFHVSFQILLFIRERMEMWKRVASRFPTFYLILGIHRNIRDLIVKQNLLLMNLFHNNIITILFRALEINLTYLTNKV